MAFWQEYESQVYYSLNYSIFLLREIERILVRELFVKDSFYE